MAIHFGILLFDGFDELDGIAPWEVLRNAAASGAPFQVTLFTAGPTPEIITGSHGLRVTAERAGPPAQGFDWVIVPGGGWATRAPQGTWAEIQRGGLAALLRDLRGRGASMASVCTGAMLLSAAGLTRGRACTTHTVARAALHAEGANLIDARVVDDGDLVTAGGVTSGIDLALWLTERLAGASIARAVETEMEYHRADRVHHGPRSDQPPAGPAAPAMRPATTPAPPYFAVSFTTTRTDVDEGYAQMAAEMEALATQQPGYLGIESARGADGLGITISYWRDEESIRRWKEQAEHQLAQRLGRERWYRGYTTRVARVERAYSFQRSD